MKHESIHNKLNYFLKTKQIPNIIFHGDSGSGKRTIVNEFLLQIYGDKSKLKSNVMMVNCCHGKGIKFIREDLKFFAKTNISSNKNTIFKSIVLLNADSLTIDAQSALRRCIEVFCNNTRFFIIVENKHKLLLPIISRFCEIYVPKFIKLDDELPINLHEENIKKHYHSIENYDVRYKALHETLMEFISLQDYTLSNIVKFSNVLYEKGFSVKFIIDSVSSSSSNSSFPIDMKVDKELLRLCYFKLKPDFRCERMFFFYILEMMFMCSNEDLKNMLLI